METLNHKRVLITGAARGLGRALSLRLAKEGSRLILVDCDAAGLADTAGLVSESATEVATFECDLTDPQQISQTVVRIREQFQGIDVLINNAGLFPAKQQMTQQGFEMQFGVNHLSHFLLSQLLLPLMLGQPSARIITVSSMLHQKAKLDFASFKGAAQYSGQRAYGQSKLANVLFAFELAERLSGTQVTSNALHPGGVATDIVRDLPWLVRKLLGLVFITPEEGAKTSILLASDPSLNQTTGAYYDQCLIKNPAQSAQDQGLRTQLWDYSLEAVGLAADTFSVPAQSSS